MINQLTKKKSQNKAKVKYKFPSQGVKTKIKCLNNLNTKSFFKSS